MVTLLDYARSLEDKSVEVREPSPHRHNKTPVLVFHRFAVNGGITKYEAHKINFLRDFCGLHAFWKDKGKIKGQK